MTKIFKSTIKCITILYGPNSVRMSVIIGNECSLNLQCFYVHYFSMECLMRRKVFLFGSNELS